jgi:hypothetical protein
MSAPAKKSFVVRLDPSTLEAYASWASDEFRSVNGQMEYVLTQALRQSRSNASAPSGLLPTKPSKPSKNGPEKNPLGVSDAALPDGVGPV